MNWKEKSVISNPMLSTSRSRAEGQAALTLRLHHDMTKQQQTHNFQLKSSESVYNCLALYCSIIYTPSI
jgi:hypothetical protein